MSTSHKCRVPIERATKEELVAAIKSNCHCLNSLERDIEQSVWNIRCDGYSKRIQELLALAQRYKQQEGKPFDPRRYARWRDLHMKIQRISDLWDKLLGIEAKGEKP